VGVSVVAQKVVSEVSPGSRKYGYSEVLADLQGFDGWLKQHGVEPKNDRIHYAVELVRKAEEGSRKARETGYTTELENPEEFYSGLVEALEFRDIFCAFQSSPSEQFLCKLHRALSGPMRPTDETHRNSDGRNVMFELALAAEWKLRGLKIQLGEPDFRLALGNTSFLVECKRPGKVESVVPNVRDAGKQLKSTLDKPDRATSFGVVAISAARVLNPGSQIFVEKSEKEFQQLGDLLQGLMEETRPMWRIEKFHPRLSTVIFHVTTPGRFDDDKLLWSFTQLVFMPASTAGPAFHALKEGLERQLAAKAADSLTP
jgi:hypothetical protein